MLRKEPLQLAPCPMISNAAIIMVAVPLALLLATSVVIFLVIFLVRRSRKRKQIRPDERDNGTDIEMVRIHQVNDVFTFATIQY